MPVILSAPLRLTAMALAPALLLGASARGEERPLTFPTRDVDISYEMAGPAGADGQRVLSQRVRWAASAGKERVDSPTPGFYMLVDHHAGRMWTVHEARRAAIEMDDGVSLPPGVSRAENFHRGQDIVVTGLPCTEWRTRDKLGDDAVVCLTSDGVLLRLRVGEFIVVEAKSVTYGPIPDSVFAIPAGFARVVPKQE